MYGTEKQEAEIKESGGRGTRDGRLGWGNSATLRTQTLLKF